MIMNNKLSKYNEELILKKAPPSRGTFPFMGIAGGCSTLSPRSDNAILQAQVLQRQMEATAAASAAGASSVLGTSSTISFSSANAAVDPLYVHQRRLEPIAKTSLSPSSLVVHGREPLLSPATTSPLLVARAGLDSPSGELLAPQLPFLSTSDVSPYSDSILITSKKSDTEEEYKPRRTASGEVFEPFPQKLYRMIQEAAEEDKSDVISFFPHGRGFAIHKPRTFVSEIMPKYLTTKRLSSFQRQLNLYGFKRITEGPDAGGFRHEYFIDGQPQLLRRIRRKKAGDFNNGKAKEDFAVTTPSALDPLTMATLLASKDTVRKSLLQRQIALLQMRNQQAALQQERARSLIFNHFGASSS